MSFRASAVFPSTIVDVIVADIGGVLSKGAPRMEDAV
jgi:hypothetical protein